jgi:uncharacterized membrane protein
MGVMTRKGWKWTSIFGLLAVIDLVLSLHGYAVWSPQRVGPSIAPLGVVVGFFSSAVLIVLTVLVIIGGVRGARRERSLDRYFLAPGAPRPTPRQRHPRRDER